MPEAGRAFPCGHSPGPAGASRRHGAFAPPPGRLSSPETGRTGAQMIRHFLTGLCLSGLVALGLAACAPVPGVPDGAQDVQKGPGEIDGYSLAPEIVTRAEPGPPSTIPGECWAHDVLPAVIETVTEHVETTPGVFTTVTRQQIVHDSRPVWFRAPCPAQMTPDFIASLQRALKARGLYRAPLTGAIDGVTRHAVRRYQAALGLDSAKLSLGAARQLGLAAYSLWDLKHNAD